MNILKFQFATGCVSKYGCLVAKVGKIPGVVGFLPIRRLDEAQTKILDARRDAVAE
ncbi:hypothetical protein [Mesorhizobium ciceri]|uniref:hypothetical protein n=1 Tax=Mesorhizobium ciceri TaxID=39645 RepID=UPI00375638C8